jgi:DNA-directed RNA polymerase subunit RPC12/RpoP
MTKLLRLYDYDGSGLAGIAPSKLRWSGRFVNCARCGERFFSAGRASQKPDGHWVVKRNWAGAANRCPSCEIAILTPPPAKPWADTPARTMLGAALLTALLVLALAGCHRNESKEGLSWATSTAIDTSTQEPRWVVPRAAGTDTRTSISTDPWFDDFRRTRDCTRLTGVTRLGKEAWLCSR